MNDTLEKKRRLYQSIIWARQKDYYTKKGLKAWNPDETPEFISSNAYTARYYAKLINELLNDLNPDSSDISYILDLGSGSGCFAYHFLKAIEENPPTQRIMYVLVDYSQANLDTHLKNPLFKQWMESGLCDVACVNLLNPIESIQLQHSKKNITSNHITQPLIAIANYFFCSLPVDFLELDDNHVRLAESTVTKPINSKDYRRASIKLQYKRPLLDSDTPTSNHFNHALFKGNDYPCRVAMPSAAFQVMDELQHFANGRLALFCSDIATDDPKEALSPQSICFRKKDGNLWLPLDMSTFHHWHQQHGWEEIFFEPCLHFFTAVFSTGIPSDALTSLHAFSSKKEAYTTPLAMTQMLFGREQTPCTLLKALDTFAFNPHLLVCEKPALIAFTEHLPYFKKQLKQLLRKHHAHVYFHGAIQDKANQVLASLFYAVNDFKKAHDFFNRSHLSPLDASDYRKYHHAQQLSGQSKKEGFIWRYIRSQLLSPAEWAVTCWKRKWGNLPTIYTSITLIAIVIFLFLHAR